jgi:hypothetical protein
MELCHIIAVRKRPDREIEERTVPSARAARTMRGLTDQGWETVFINRKFQATGGGSPRRE